jgi:hypothetical protein
LKFEVQGKSKFQIEKTQIPEELMQPPHPIPKPKQTLIFKFSHAPLALTTHISTPVKFQSRKFQIPKKLR